MNQNNLIIVPIQNTGIGQKEYLQSVKSMIIRAREIEPTIVLHTDDEICEKYNKSVVAILDGKIVGSSSLYETSMTPFDNFSFDGEKQKIGEIGSVIVDQNYRKHGIGKSLTQGVISQYAHPYNAIISATVHNTMTHIFSTLGFQNIPFPQSYFDEGKKYLSPYMQGGEREFEERARCVLLMHNGNSNLREKIIDTIGFETLYPSCFLQDSPRKVITYTGNLFFSQNQYEPK